MSKFPTDKDFQNLAACINNAIIKNEGAIGDQKAQVNLVFDLECKFQKSIKKYKQTEEIYRKFIHFIIKDVGNILSAQSYFREKHDIFIDISNKIKEEDAVGLMQYHANFQLINFIVNNWTGDLPKRAQAYYDKFINSRNILIENNLPLAINRAKLFYRKTPRSHLTLLDFIGICTWGLISGIDKYVGDYTNVWRSVCIGRMVGYLIEEYSKTFIRMYPTDKKILYRANALKYRLKIDDLDELTKAVNESFEKDKQSGKNTPTLPITTVHIQTLLNSSSQGSIYHGVDGSSAGEINLYDFTPCEEENPEESAIKNDLIRQLIAASKDLNIIEKKIIQLKGVSL